MEPWQSLSECSVDFLMKYSPQFQAARYLVCVLLLPALLVTIDSGVGSLFAKDPSKAKAQPAASMAAETAREFLGDLEKGDVNAAIGLWDANSANDKLKARLEKMAAKLKKAGGIKKVD